MAVPYVPPSLPATRFLENIPDLLGHPNTKVLSDRLIGKKFLCVLPGGQIYFDSKLDLDTDGSEFAVPNAKGVKQDPWGQAETSAKDASGKSLDADKINYFVLPGGFPEKHGIQLGDVGVVMYESRMTFGCFGDTGPSKKLGEASIALHRALGHETVNNGKLINAGIDSDVVTIVFPGSGNGFGRSNADSQLIGTGLFQKLLREAYYYHGTLVLQQQETWTVGRNPVV